MSYIAKHCGVSKANLFHHFASKEKLYEASIIHAFAVTSEIWRTLAGSIHDSSYATVMAKVLEFQQENADLIKLMIWGAMSVSNSASNNSTLKRAAQRYFRETAQAFAEHLPAENHAEGNGRALPENLVMLMALSIFYTMFKDLVQDMEELQFMQNSEMFSEWVLGHV